MEGTGIEVVQRELDRLLASPAFRGSKRCSDFLRFVVEASLNGSVDRIKERTIGVEVFGRKPDYDTSEDAIVRVRANEVRKRLAQAYQELGSPADVVIDLPAGSYAPEFRYVTNPVTALLTPPPAPSTRAKRLQKWTYAAFWMILVALVIAVVTWAIPRSPYERFWTPVLGSSGEVILCAAHPVVFTMSAELRDEETPTVDRSDLNRDEEHYVGIGDAQAMARIAAFLSSHGKHFQLRLGNDTSFTDLRSAPAILIGAFTNQWTMQLTRDLRFVFERDASGRIWVQDQQPPGQRFEYQRTNPPMDFVIISRIFDSPSGRLVVSAAGLAHFGTQVAGEFLTTPDYLNEALKKAPSGWESKNLQLVLRAEVRGKAPGPPTLVAIHVW